MQPQEILWIHPGPCVRFGQQGSHCLSGAMDVLEVLGSADTILPMVATTMTTSAATSASAACPGQLSHAGNEPTTNGQQQANRKESTGQLVGQQATASGHQSQGQHTTAPSEQTQEAHAAASAEQRSAGLHLNALDQQPAGQHQTASNAGASLAEQHQDDVGADSAGQAQHAPEGQAEPAGPHQAAPAADPDPDPSSAGQESNKPDETPIWLQPMSPLESHVTSSASGSHVNSKKHEQRQRQEQRHKRARIMPAGRTRLLCMPTYLIHTHNLSCCHFIVSSISLCVFASLAKMIMVTVSAPFLCLQCIT